MRGDSLRDLYAKTLALVGLALLGGIGALVDYWPAGAAAPAVSSVRLSEPEPLLARAFNEAEFADVWTRPAATVRVARASAPRVRPADPFAVTGPIAVAAGDRTTMVALSDPPAPPLLDALPISAIAAPNALPGLGLNEPWVPESLPVTALAETALTPLRLSESLGEDDGSFLSDATDLARKAGSTILSGTVKAGAPFVGVARLLGGAFRKITPFKN